MSTPQDARARKREKRRRALKNDAWKARQAAANAAADEPKTSAKKAT